MWRRLHDDLGRPVALAAPPRRIVSLVPSLTELVCALGRGDRLVGVTRYCTEPSDVVAGLHRVGGTKNPDVSSIVALAPELVLVNAEENRHEDFQSLIAAGLTIWVSFPRTVEQTVASIERVGEGLDVTASAAAMAGEIAAALANPPGRHARIFCPIWRKPWMSFNRDTYAHDLLRCAGGDNVCSELADRYPVVDLHAIAQTDPQVILLPDEPYPFAERHRQALGPLLDTSAGRSGRIHLVDGKALSWYGPRTAAALRVFRRLLAGT
jgi:ABC-type Fe3+-hydroxamate transport system substrate-binding protein